MESFVIIIQSDISMSISDHELVVTGQFHIERESDGNALIAIQIDGNWKPL